MNGLIQIYSTIVSKLIHLYHKDKGGIEPVYISRAKAIARASVVLSLHLKNKDQRVYDTISGLAWLKLRLNGRCPLIDWLETLSHEEKTIVNIDFDSLPNIILGDAYEQLLSVDSFGMEVSAGKKYRNTLGSYYSPIELVEDLTKRVIAQYVKSNGIEALRQAKIVDFSCGAGAFIVSAIRTILSTLGETPKSKSHIVRAIIKNVYACDVDCIALEVCKLSVIELVEDYSIYSDLSENFVFGNFLLHTNTSSDSITKEQLYLNGFIYHEGLAIGVDFLTQYDIILGNPPWEKVRFEEKKFFSQYLQEIDSVNFKTDLQKSVNSIMSSNEALDSYSSVYRNEIDLAKKRIKGNYFFKQSSIGELNTSTLFADACYNLRSDNGCVGIIIKSSTIAAPVNQHFFKNIKSKIISIYDFINRNKYFDIDSRERFAFLILGNREKKAMVVGMNLVNVSEIKNVCVEIEESDLDRLNSETGMLPNITSPKDLNILLGIHREFKPLNSIFERFKYGRIVHYTSHIDFLDKKPGDDNIPVYEGKFFNSFDGKYSGYNHVPHTKRYVGKARTIALSEKEKSEGVMPEARFFIKKTKWHSLSNKYNATYMLAWHSLTSATNGRACVATILPFIPASQSVQFLTTANKKELIYTNGLFNSVVFDYLVKNKLTGIDLTQTIIKQIPIPSIEDALRLQKGEKSYYEIIEEISASILQSDDRLHEFFVQTKVLTIGKKALIQKLDIVIAKLYRLSSATFDYICSCYPQVYNEEQRSMLLKEFTAF